MPKEIVIKIGKDGNAEVEVNGVKGGECFGITEKLRAAMGTVVSTEIKPDYYDRPEEVKTNGATVSH